MLITGCDENHAGTGQDWVVVRDPYPYERGHSPYAEAGYRFDAASGTVLLPWRALRERLNRTSVVFLEKRSV